MLADHASVVLIGTTVGSANNSRASCSSATAPDVAYAITPAANGVLTLRFSALYDGAVFVRSSCDPASSELSCATANFGVTTDTVNVTAGTTVIVWVDAIGGGAGSYALQVGLNVTCGNRAIDGGEQCDDGNNISGDGCSATCNVEVGRSDACPAGGAAGYPLANGPVWFGGNTNGLGAELVSSCVANGDSDIVYAITPTVSGTLRATVYPASAWNAQLYVRTACDTTPDVACANANPQGRQETVTLSVTAGTTYYVVVDGDTSGTAPGTGPFRLSLDIARCGDRVLQSGETCDDGNNVPNDGCDATCATEAMCRGMETEPNPFNAPNAITLPCATNDWFGSINPANDNDFYSVMTLTAGQVLDARTFIGSATQCGAATDTILELFRGPLASAPANNDCGGSGALVCNDDVFAGDLCSNVVYPVPSGGQYVLRTNSYRFGQTINNYGLQVIAR